MGTMLNVAAYHFTSLSDPAGLAAGLRLAATDAALKGTILVLAIWLDNRKQS